MVNENIIYTVSAVCYSYDLSQESIKEMVSWGIANPVGNNPEKWLFTHEDYERIGKASRFKNELDINIPGAALALQLLDDIQNIRNKRC